MKPSLKNASIGRILMMSYVSIIVLFVVSICVAVFGVHQNSAMTTEFYEQPYRVSKSALSLRSTVEQISNQLKQCLVTEDSLERERLVDTINQLAIEREAEYNVIAANFKSDAKVLDQFALASEALLSARDEVVDELRSGNTEQANTVYEQDYLPQKDVTLVLADGIIDAAEQDAHEYSQETTYVEIATSIIIILLGLLTIGLVIVLWRRITRAIAVPVGEIEGMAKRVAESDLTVHVIPSSRNELGELAASMNKTVAALRLMVEQMKATADQVERSSSQMSDGSQTIAQGSAEQAMNIEELATSVQDITQVVEENNESVLIANENTADVLSAVEQHSGGRVSLEDYNGFSRTNPRLALLMTLALFSLAGIPPFAGFFSKFFVFAAAFSGGFHLLVFIALVNTVVSLYYYLLIVKAMYIMPGDAPIAAFRSDRYTRVSLALCMAGVLLLGIVSAVYDGINAFAFGL